MEKLLRLSGVVLVLGCGALVMADDSGPAAQDLVSASRGVLYELQEGSTLSYTYRDDTGAMNTRTVEIEGWFCRQAGSVRPLYNLVHLSFHSLESTRPVTVTGRGTYQALQGHIVPERMDLAVAITGFPQPDDVQVRLSSGDVWHSEGTFPTIIIDVLQVVSTPEWFYSMHLIATPLRNVEFSTDESFSGASPAGTERLISEGDLLRNTGVIVRTNRELMRNFRVMPPMPDVGLDAVSMCPWCPPEPWPGPADEARRCVIFSIEDTIWCESLGTWLQHGDLLCERGTIFMTNGELIAEFGLLMSDEDVGCDAAYVDESGEVFFSTEIGFWVVTPEGLRRWISPDDMLSSRGRVVKTLDELLGRFSPIAVPASLGLDALYVLDNGEVYFSLESGFYDGVYGAISDGDLLSDAGYVVARNRELIDPFHPREARDAGLDAVLLNGELGCLTPIPEVVHESD